MYISTMQNKDGKIFVAERRNGERVFTSYDPDYHFYISDPKGEYMSMYGNPVRRIEASSKDERKRNKMAFGRVKTWESDTDATMRCLEQNYKGSELPNLHVAFFDIETDFDKDLGYSEAVDALNPITSISIFLQWSRICVCIAVPPKTLTFEQAKEMTKHQPEVILVRTEAEMLQLFLQLIDDADVLSGWNSEAYDITYTTNRIMRVLGKVEARNLCFWGQMPRKRTYNTGINDVTTYELEGRIHLDYLVLYKKFTYEEQQSYSLNSIATAELGETKVEYEGTLDQLYNNDFVKFLEYNIQDTMLLDRLDEKLQLIKLVNTVAHVNCVPLETVLGTVALVEQAIMLEAHDRGMVVKDKPPSVPGALRAAGGWVAHPKQGLHRYIASTDMKSLYPSVIRAWNMSPETIVGQLRLSETERHLRHHLEVRGEDKFAEWWNDRFEPLEMLNFINSDNANKMTLDMESGERYEITGAELRKLVFDPNEPFCISANGTIFRTDEIGLIPGILSRWYSERKGFQKSAKEVSRIINGLPVEPEILDIVGNVV